MNTPAGREIKRIELDLKQPVWRKFFMVSPLVVIGTREGDHYDLAPKHMVAALGQENYFGFVCTPGHSTYQNARREKAFSVSYIRPDQVVLASLTATPRGKEASIEKGIVRELATWKASSIDALMMCDAYAWLECALDRIVDDFGQYSLVAGKVIKAYVHQDDLRLSERDEARMIRENPLLAYIAYGRFAEISETLGFPFPKGFDRRLIDQ